MNDDDFLNRVGNDRISSRQVDELIGLARGLCADNVVNQAEAEFLQKWLAANSVICDQPLIRDLFTRVSEMLLDGIFNDTERIELFETLKSFGCTDFELGEVLKSTSLPLCDPPPNVEFMGREFAFTGTFQFGQRKHCEKAVVLRGAATGAVTQRTDFLVIGAYATESWKHSSMGTKILKACKYRDQGQPISIISEGHWASFL